MPRRTLAKQAASEERYAKSHPDAAKFLANKQAHDDFLRRFSVCSVCGAKALYEFPRIGKFCRAHLAIGKAKSTSKWTPQAATKGER